MNPDRRNENYVMMKRDYESNPSNKLYFIPRCLTRLNAAPCIFGILEISVFKSIKRDSLHPVLFGYTVFLDVSFSFFER